MHIPVGYLINGQYRVIAPLGAGGMGSVFLAEDTKFRNQKVAVKLLLGSLLSDEQQLKRFQQELYLARKLSHQNIVKVFSYGETDDGYHFIVMEYVEGSSLDKLVGKGGLDFPSVLKILYGIARALASAHAEGVIHRDLKPANVLVARDRSIKLADFGLATSLVEDAGLTKTNHIVGTSHYMAPEQWMHGKVDGRADIYAFALVAYELVVGKRPYDASNPKQLMYQHLEKPLPPVARKGMSVPGWFDSFVRQCAAKDPGLRYQTARDMVLLLGGELKKLGVDVSDDEQLRAPVANQGERNSPYLSVLPVLRWWNSRDRLTKSVYLAALNVAFYWALVTLGVVKAVDVAAYDYFLRLRGEERPPDKVVVVGIDEESFSALGVPPTSLWPRRLHAELLNKLAKVKPKAVLFDMAFEGTTVPEEDASLAVAMNRVPTFLALASVHRIRRKGKGFVQTATPIVPDDIFQKSAQGLFTISNKPDADGVYRRFPMEGSLRFLYPPLAPVVFGSESFGRHQVPAPGDLIRYYGPAGTVTSIPYEKLFAGDTELLRQLSDAWVLVGLMTKLPVNNSVPDTFQTPYLTRISGVECLATRLGNLLEQRWVRNYSEYQHLFATGLLLSLGLIHSAFLSRGVAGVESAIVLSLPLMQYAWLLNDTNFPVAGLSLVLAMAVGVKVYLKTYRISAE